jgi:hypothetical protein
VNLYATAHSVGRCCVRTSLAWLCYSARHTDDPRRVKRVCGYWVLLCLLYVIAVLATPRLLHQYPSLTSHFHACRVRDVHDGLRSNLFCISLSIWGFQLALLPGVNSHLVSICQFLASYIYITAMVHTPFLFLIKYYIDYNLNWVCCKF